MQHTDSFMAFFAPIATEYAMNTLAVAGVMAAGILVVSTAVRMWAAHKMNHRL